MTIKHIFFIITCLLLVSTKAYALPSIEPVTLSEIAAKSSFSDYDAEIIRKTMHIEVDENFHETYTTYVAIKINSSNAISDYSQLKISYDSFYEESELIFANTIDENGNRQALDPNALQIQTPPSPYFFQDRRNIVFSVPSLKPGTVIEYQYQTKTTQLRIPNYWGSNLSFYFWQPVSSIRSYRIDPVRSADYVVTTPESLNVKLRYFNGNGQFDTKKTSANGLLTYYFNAKNLPALEFEQGMPSTQEFIPYISLSTLDDWSKIKEWAYGLFNKEHIINDDVRRIASLIKAKRSTEQGLIRGVYEYLNNNIRYVYSHVGRGGFTPHQPSHTLDQGFGDCKDQTMLAVALLNELGIEAYAALVNTESSIRFDIEKYMPSFDHMLVYMPQQPEGYRWMDSTSDKAMYPGSLNFMSERSALILSDNPDITFITGEKQAPSDNGLNLEISIDKAENKKLIGTIKILPTGSFEAYYRAFANQNNETEKRSYFASILSSVYNNAQVTSYSVENNNDLFSPVTATINFEINSAWEGAPTPLSYSLSYQHIWRKFFQANAIENPDERKMPLFNSLNYSMNLRFKSTIPEEDYYPKTASSGIDIDNEYFSIKNSLNSTETESELVIQGEFHKSWIDVKDYKKYFDTYDSWLKSSYWVLSYVQDKSRRQESALLLQSEESIDATNQLIQLHLDEGEFEKALTAATKATQRADVTGHTYYLLGLSQAYNDDADASEASFKKAQELGYE